MNDFTEDNLAQATLADHMEGELGWRSVFAFNQETYGAESTLGRESDQEVVLTRYLSEALIKLNPNLPEEAYQNALRAIADVFTAQSMIQTNRDKYLLLRNGVSVRYTQEGKRKQTRLRVFDFDQPANNDFLCVRELWVRGAVHRRRADVVGFVNGLPLLFVELKRPDKSLRRAYEDNLSDYKDTIAHLFHFNAFVVLGNGIDAKLGSITAQYEHFTEWKRLSERAEGEQGDGLPMETLLNGLCSKSNFMDMFENFVLFTEAEKGLAKIVARNHQFLGVNRALQSVVERETREGKLGVFWHTQGSGKSYSMAFFAQKVHRKLGADFTFLVLTDRADLDKQIYATFANSGLANNDKDPCRAGSGKQLKRLLGQQKKYVFSLIQKFNEDIEEGQTYSERSNIIVMSDEAHRSQYGSLALNMRNALPNANFIGFTGTPLFSNDEITQRVFGDYVSTYDFQRAIEDEATLPLYYDARGDKLNVSGNGLNEKLAAAIEDAEIEDADVAAKLESELKREYHVVTAEKRLKHIAADFCWHYSTNWETGKAMYVAIDKITAVRMHDYIQAAWQQRITELQAELLKPKNADEIVARRAQIAWMQATEIAVVVSDEQNEVKKFQAWGLDILPHRKRMKDGYTITETEGGRQFERRLDMESAYKREDHPFRIVIVCAMWLTGFDVPSLSTLYLDKPLQAHTLMQAIARANRVHEGKNNGLIVDYCGILKNLRKALATFAGHKGEEIIDGEAEQPIVDPLNPDQKLLDELKESILHVKSTVLTLGFDFNLLQSAEGFTRNKALIDAKEAINQNDETRKRFEIAARAVFRKYKACLTFKGINKFKGDYDAIRFVNNSLDKDKVAADTSDIMQKLNAIVSEAIEVREDRASDDKVFDISKINFDLLRKEFERSKRKNTDVQDIKTVVENRLAQLLRENPLRTDFQDRFDEIVKGYNKEKDKNTIEATFEALMRLTAEMGEESQRKVKEGLETEEQLAIYDMLLKPDLSKADIKKIKKVSVGLLQSLEAQMREVQDLFSKESTRDKLRQSIYDYLYDEQTGLPVDQYDETELMTKTGIVFNFFQHHAHRSSAHQDSVRV